LKAAVESTLGVTDPTPADMLSLTSLMAMDNDIQSLTGLEHATNLTDLDLATNQIVNLAPLSSLAQLQTLLLDFNQITDINDLTALMNLQRLDLTGNPLNQQACDTHIPQIQANNPGIQLTEDACNPGTCGLTISATNDGEVWMLKSGFWKHVDGATEFDCGDLVRFNAECPENADFVNWTGTAVDAGKVTDPDSSITYVLIDGNYTLVANFKSDKCTLTISSTDGGQVCLPSSGDLLVITPIDDGEYEYTCGAEERFYAVAEAYYRFVSWTGTAVTAGKIDDPDSSFVTCTVDADYTLTANFEPIYIIFTPDPSPTPED
jgi:hypothetical protein